MTHADAIEEIASGAGRQFDPDITGMLYMRPHGAGTTQTRALSL